MSITVAVRHRLGGFTLDAAFETHGSLTAISGASGSGKTTVINTIAGLIRPDDGRIAVNGDVLLDTAGGIFVPAHRRRIGYVFQDARLFPHLTVAQNLGFGRWFAPREGRYASESQVLELLGIGHLLKRRPSALSGGEKQRVAIGRALLASPRLLLMDEPLASLDDARKAEILPYIERLRDEFRVPIVYVSHSMAEVTRLATDIVLMAEGRVAACGPSAEIVQRLDLIPSEERDEGGTLLDMNILGYDPAFDMTELKCAAGTAHVPGRLGEKGTRVRVRIRARDVMIATSEPKNISALNIFSGTVAEIAASGRASVNVTLDCSGTPVLARITRQSCEAMVLRRGTSAYALLKAVSVAPPGMVPAAGEGAAT
jgi:molybdate transport system ATP-binding protein